MQKVHTQTEKKKDPIHQMTVKLSFTIIIYMQYILFEKKKKKN